jgi:outer membrane lipopolysaccharide assembly protein LptE/RlpB
VTRSPLRRLAVVLALAAGLAAGACGAADQVSDEVDAQTDRARTVIEDPAGAADRALQRELEERGIDGQAPSS